MKEFSREGLMMQVVGSSEVFSGAEPDPLGHKCHRMKGGEVYFKLQPPPATFYCIYVILFLVKEQVHCSLSSFRSLISGTEWMSIENSPSEGYIYLYLFIRAMHHG